MEQLQAQFRNYTAETSYKNQSILRADKSDVCDLTRIA